MIVKQSNNMINEAKVSSKMTLICLTCAIWGTLVFVNTAGNGLLIINDFTKKHIFLKLLLEISRNVN